MPELDQPTESTVSPGAEAWTLGRFTLLLLIGTVLLFGGPLVGASSFVFRDFGLFGYPLAAFHRDSFWRGEVPLWNYYNNCGIPFLAQWNTLTCYPLSVIYLLLPLPWSLNLFCLFHFVLAGLGMYWLGRDYLGRGFPAAVAGMAYMFNGLTLNCLMWPNNIAAVGLAPWVLWAVRRGWRNGGCHNAWAALLGALQMLSGAPEIILFTWLIIGLIALADLITRQAQPLRLLMRFGGIVLLVAGLSAVQLLPFFQLLAHSHRDPASMQHFSPMPYWGWANLVVPLFHLYRTAPGVFLQMDQVWTSSYYPGIIVLGLAMLGLLKRTERAWPLALVVSAGLVLALGEAGYVYKWMRAALPHLAIMNFPIKFVYPAIFGAALLAGWGGLALVTAPSSEKRELKISALSIASFFTLIAVALVFVSSRYPYFDGEVSWVGPNAAARIVFLSAGLAAGALLLKPLEQKRRFWVETALLSLLWLDVVTHAPNQNPTVANSIYEQDLQPIRKLAPLPELGKSRAMLSLEALRHLKAKLHRDLFAGYAAHRLALFDNCNLIERLPKLDGFFSLYLRDEPEVRLRLYLTVTNREPLLEYLSISQIAEGAEGAWRARTNFMPWITAGQQPKFFEPANLLRQVLAPDFKPREQIYLPLAAQEEFKQAVRAEVRLRNEKFSASRVEFEYTAEKPVVLSIAQAHYPAWKVWIDGRESAVWKANAAFQAIAGPAGTHQVVLIYRDGWFRAGAVISLTTAVLIILSGVTLYRRDTAKLRN